MKEKAVYNLHLFVYLYKIHQRTIYIKLTPSFLHTFLILALYTRCLRCHRNVTVNQYIIESAHTVLTRHKTVLYTAFSWVLHIAQIISCRIPLSHQNTSKPSRHGLHLAQRGKTPKFQTGLSSMSNRCSIRLKWKGFEGKANTLNGSSNHSWTVYQGALSCWKGPCCHEGAYLVCNNV